MTTIVCGNCGRSMTENPTGVYRCFRCKRTVQVVVSVPPFRDDNDSLSAQQR